jgi:spore coat protein U-like protein
MPLTRFLRIAGPLLGLLALPVTGHAQSLVASCTVGSSAAAFNVYSPLNASPTTTTATVSVSCNAPVQLLVAYTISLSPGSSGSVAARTMRNGTWAMSYQLYSNATYTTIWGDGTGGSQTVSDGFLLSVGGPVARNYTAYGKIPALQNVGAGSYLDTINVLVTY